MEGFRGCLLINCLKDLESVHRGYLLRTVY